ncbi:MAG TPA: PEGA domain-containing protein, partial [Polyangiales bacterium]
MLAVLATTSSVRAQGDEYKRLTDAAVEEHALAHYEEARALFARAHAIQPSARTFWGMGIAAFEDRDYVDAIQLLEQARADTRKPLTPAQRAKTDSLIERAHAYVVRLPLRVEPASALVTIDGREVVRDAQGIVMLDAGPHQIVVSAPGYQEAVRSMTWHAGDATPFEISLEVQRAVSDASAVPEEASAPPPAAHTEAPRADRNPAPRSYTVLKWVSLGA